MTTPILAVDGDPADWLPKVPYASHGDPCPCGNDDNWHQTPARSWLAVDELPHEFDVVRAEDGENSIVARPLAAGDRVTLATVTKLPGAALATTITREFAEATVAEVLPVTDDDCHPHPHVFVNCGYSSWHPDGDTWAYIPLPNARPGGWAIRLSYPQSFLNK